MRNVQNQNKRMRGRNNNNNNRKSHNPLTRVYESNGPDVKIRGTASHIAEKYIQLARDAQASGDPVGAENYYQHAEHYFRLIAAAQEQMRQNQPQYGQRQETFSGNDMRDGTFEDEPDDESVSADGEQPAFGTREPQPFIPRDANFYGQGAGDQSRPAPASNGMENVDRLPSFITGAQPLPQENGQGGGYENSDGGQQRFQGERHERQGFRRRRRHRGGYRSEGHASATAAGSDDGGDAPN